jgi:hypothetical protein
LLFVLIPAVLLVAALFGVGMCRLAALSDRHHEVAVAEWILANELRASSASAAEAQSEEHPFDPPGEAFRATG